VSLQYFLLVNREMLEELSGGERLVADWALAPDALRILGNTRDLRDNPNEHVSNHLRRKPLSGKMSVGVETQRSVEFIVT
jgi:hypothetical protein